MLNTIFPRHGAVLNRHHGVENGQSLRITVRGTSTSLAPILVNGATARREGRDFAAEVDLTAKFNDIIVTTTGGYGECSQKIRVLWDKKSFPRYNFYIDDHSFFLTDIAQQRPKSLFEHFYLGGLRKVHANYGTKFTLNCFYRNDHHPFLMTEFPDRYKAEWADNCDWLRLSFHSYSEWPDRPYQDPNPTQILADYDLVKREIERFAGPQTFIKPPVIHWAVASPEAVSAMARSGRMTLFCGGFRGAKAACDEAIEKGLDPVTSITTLDRAAVSDIGYSRSIDDAIYLYCYKKLYDFELDALFFSGSGTCCNLFTKEQIVANFARSARAPFGNETYGLGSHEQYTFPYYPGYIPDHLERIDTAARQATEIGAKPVYFSEGLLGNHSWE
ncbi:MAG: hypothetical protein GX595_14320 [Lentisphaerae bacterium]|nr:hypothetical protein [Lentisphaerota bacterium]